MRVNLNLATQPYEDVRDFLLKWGLGLVLAVVASAALVWLAVSGWRQSRDIERDMRVKQQEIGRLKEDEKKAQAMLDEPRNSGTRAQAALLNSLIARKAFSWTQAFSDFEKLMPARVQVMSIQPQLDPDNQLTINLVVTSPSRDRAIELLKNLEDSKHFEHAQLLSEANDPEGKEGTRFQITAVYVPPTSETPQAAARASSGGAP
jgi:type IV pilus assembly protein PilN